MRVGIGLIGAALALAAILSAAGVIGGRAYNVEAMVARMLTLDADHDGRLTKDEVADARLHPLFDEIDADRDGVATQDELTNHFTAAAAAAR